MFNLFRNIILLLLLSLTWFRLYSQCNSNFDYIETSPLEVQFQSASTSFSEESFISYWDFGDGNNSFVKDPIHYYSSPGIYKVSLSIITADSCFSQKNKQVYVGIPKTSPYCSLEIEFETNNATAPDYNNGSAKIIAYSDFPCCYSAFWSNGDEGEIIGNLSPGTYCVTITNGDFCYGSQCVTIGYNNNCEASFNIDSTTFSFFEGAYKFVNNSHGEASFYLWNFDDGTYSKAYNPLHVFPDTGSYHVCLTINTYYGCLNTYCKDLHIGKIIPSTANLHGVVFAGEALLPKGISVLYEFDDDRYKAIKYANIENGKYEFNLLPKDKLYTTHLIPIFNLEEIYFPKYIASYFNLQNHWEPASFINLNQDTLFTTNLYSYNTVYYGNGRISGEVNCNYDEGYETSVFARDWLNSSSDTSSNVSNITVFLKNSFRHVMDFCLTDFDGKFVFKNLKNGYYYISVEKPGFVSEDVFVEISDDIVEQYDVNFSINQNAINYNKLIFHSNELNIYPNPATNEIFIDNFSDLKNFEYSILNQAGQTLSKGKILSNKIDISNLANGVYYLKIEGKVYKICKI